MPFLPSTTLTHSQQKEHSVVSFLIQVLVANNLSIHYCLQAQLQII